MIKLIVLIVIIVAVYEALVIAKRKRMARPEDNMKTSKNKKAATSSVDATMCSKCGVYVAEGSDVCTHCGAKLG